MREALDLILERDAELAAISMMSQAAATGSGSLAIVTGPSGIGKTALLWAAAGDSRLRVLTARGMPLEHDFSFGIVRQLFEPVRAALGETGWVDLLEGAAGLARPVFEGGSGQSGGDPRWERDPHITTHGLYWLTANIAATEPLLIVVDDSQWADAPSLRWLSYLAARIQDLPVVLLLAVQSGYDQPELIGELVPLPSCTLLAPQPLSAAATAALVRARLGRGARDEDGQEPGDEFSAACYEMTGGNPFLLHCLLDTLRDAADRGEMPTAAHVAAAGPRPVAAAVLRRIRQFGDKAGALTRAVAVLGGPAQLRHAAVLAALDLADAATLADSLRSAHVLVPAARGPAGYGEPLEFAHAIAETALYESIPSGERAIAHGRAAALLEADGADAERVALHLLRSEPAGNQRVVAALRAAAIAANGRGAPDVTVGYLRRALAEPPDGQDRPGVLLELGLALASVRDPEAVGVLEDAVAQAAPSGMADAALRSQSVLGVWGFHESALRICRGALAALDELAATGTGNAGADPDVRDSLEAAVFAESWLNAESAADAWAAVRAHSGAGSHGAAGESGASADATRARAAAVWRVYEALSATITGAGREIALELLHQARQASPAGPEPIARDTPVMAMSLLILLWNDECAVAMRVADRVLATASKRGSLNMVADISWIRSPVLLRLGRLTEAVDVGRYGLELKFRNSPVGASAWGAAYVIDGLVALGRLAEAGEIAAGITARQPPEGWIQTTMFTQARGALRVALRQYDEGLADLLDAAEGWRALGVTNPALASWRTAAITAYAATDRAGEAAALAAEQVALARAADARLPLGVALRAGAPYADDPVASLEEAAHVLNDVDADYELARALAALGTRMRRLGDRSEAQRHLRRALDLAERCGARPLSEYAHRELATAGARPRRAAQTGPESLTGAERQVAALAASGMSNRQIAQQQFITQATVETHLRQTFRKLGISSRKELPPDL